MQSEEKHKAEKATLKKGVKAIWRHARPFKKSMFVLVILGLVSAIANGFVPYITGRFFDALVALSQGQADRSIGNLPIWMIFLGIWALIQVVATNNDWAMDRLRRIVKEKIHFNIQAQGFTHLLYLPLSYHKDAHISGEIQKIGQAGWRINSIFGTIVDFVPQFLSIIVGIVLAASINVTLASVLVLGVVLYCILLTKILMPMASIDAAGHKAWNEAWDDSAAAVHQIEGVKQGAAEDYEAKKTKESFLGKVAVLWYRIERHWSNVGFFQRIIVFLTQLTVFVLSVRLIETGTISIGELIALNGYAMMFFGPFVSLGYSWQVIQNGITTAANLEEIFDTPQEVYIPENSSGNVLLKGEVVFENVSFQYAPDQPAVLNNLNMRVEVGQIVAVVGESGVGKSTAISLISGYYFPTKGQVIIDGIDTKEHQLRNLRRQIAVVPQEVALFNDTVMTNIKYGSFDATDEDVRRVAKEACVDEFISALPEGYETLVGERGIKLSVGQKQRVSIARAMLRDPAILILDEPTSALDAKTEKVVTEALEKLMKGRTTFIIAHRLSTVRKADNILVFEKGTVVETGTHDELIKKENGVYRHLYEYQVGLH